MINNKLVRRLFAFCVFFMATRDICTSFILTIIFALVMSSLVGDDSEKEVDSNEENLKQKLMNIQIQLNEIQKQL